MDEWTHSRTCTWSQRRRLSPVRLNPSRPQVWSKSASYKMNARCGRYPLSEAYITCSETVGANLRVSPAGCFMAASSMKLPWYRVTGGTVVAVQFPQIPQMKMFMVRSPKLVLLRR